MECLLLMKGGNLLKKNATLFVLLLSSIVCCILIFGLGWVLVDYNSINTTSNMESATIVDSTNDKEGIQLLALGDSLTRGTGDDEGKGYIGYLKELLSDKTNETINLANYGVKGLTSTELANMMTQKEIQRQASMADIIFITIGGNDLFQGGETLSNLDENSIKELSASYLENLHSILTKLRSVNEDAPIYLMGLYNPFSDLEDSDLSSKVVRDWNNESAEISAGFNHTIFVPTYDIFQQNVQTFLYSDHFHPNAKGYQLMAERVASLISWEVEENE